MQLVANNIEEFMQSKLSQYKGISQDVINEINNSKDEHKANVVFDLIDTAYREEGDKTYDLYIDETGRIFEYGAEQ